MLFECHLVISHKLPLFYDAHDSIFDFEPVLSGFVMTYVLF